MRRLLLALALLCGLASPARTTDVYFGNSQTMALAATMGPYGIRYPDVYAILHGTAAPNILAVSGSMAADQASVGLLQHAPVSGDRHFYMIGTIEWNSIGDDAASMQLFDMAVSADISHLAANKKAAATHADWHFTGAWTNSTKYNTSYGNGSFGKVTSTHGDVADIDFSGTSVDIAYTLLDNSSSGFYVYVDSVLLGTIASGPPRAIATPLGNTATVALLHLSGFSTGTHHLRIVSLITNASYPVTIDWIGAGSNGIPLYLLSSPLADVTKFPTAAKVHTYNTHLASLAAAAQAKGFNVTYIAASAHVDPATDVIADGSHLNSRGHVKIAKELP